MRYKYQYLTPGYLGEKVEDATLNSKFFSELFSNNIDLSKKIIFPQKVPKTQFFEEMCELEHDGVQNQFSKFINKIKRETHQVFSSINKTSYDHGANLIRILMRYGCFEDVVSIIESQFLSSEIPLEFSYLLESARVDYCLSNDLQPSLDRLQSLSESAIRNGKSQPWLKCLILNRFIVSAYKYRLTKYKKFSKEAALVLKGEVEKLKIGNTFEFMFASLFYRGLAMIEEWGNKTQDHLMQESIVLAKSAPANNLLERLIVQDNLYPCLQSIAKWNMINNHLDEAEESLNEMIKVDPYDSTSFSEMGIFLMKYNRFEEAGIHFKKAALLGAPGVGMNTYFYAKTLEQLGKENEAIDALYEVTEIDEIAISPWLDILEYYTKSNMTDKAREVASHIAQVPELKDQLEENELVKIQTLLD